MLNRITVAGCHARIRTSCKLLWMVWVDTDLSFDDGRWFRISRHKTSGSRLAVRCALLSICSIHCFFRVLAGGPASIVPDNSVFHSRRIQHTWQFRTSTNRGHALPVFGLVFYTFIVGMQLSDVCNWSLITHTGVTATGIYSHKLGTMWRNTDANLIFSHHHQSCNLHMTTPIL